MCRPPITAHGVCLLQNGDPHVTQATYCRRTAGKLLSSEKIAEIFAPWNSSRECWLFVSPHDDDIVLGCGLSFQAAIAEGIEVHAVVATDGRMGYCRLAEREAIADIRRREASQSYRLLGLPAERLHQLPFPDGGLGPYRGRRFTDSRRPDRRSKGPPACRTPSRTCSAASTRPASSSPRSPTSIPTTASSTKRWLISLFHAQGRIWPELGEPLAWIPVLYEYATYCDFLAPPQIRVAVPESLLETKLAGIRAYASQEQIDLVVDVQRAIGPIEFIREVHFRFYSPKQYLRLFELEG